jgi:trehalose 6-phosphate phosphatase
MKHILSPRNVGILEQYARTNVLLAFDYDGTLSPIVRDPAKARMRARTRKAFEQVVQRFPTAVISGRARGDVAGHVSGLPLVEILGNHGLEPSAGMEDYAAMAKAWRKALRRDLDRWEGVAIEDKVYSLSIHYRNAPAPQRAKQAIQRSIAALGSECRVVGGKRVVNLLPAGAPHKGRALQTLRDEQGADAVIFTGDDETDDDVFRLERSGGLLGIRVGRTAKPIPRYYLRNQNEVDALLMQLVRLRNDRPH